MGKPNARERILRAAGRLFHKQGYSNVGINEIIKDADTAKASFYQHFKSKEALCEAWLSEIHDISEVTREEILNSQCPLTKKVDLYFKQLAAYLAKSDFRGCPYTNTCAMVDTESEGVMKQIREHKKAICDFFRLLIAQEHGESNDYSETANQLFILYSGATTEAQNLRDLWPVESARKAARDLLERL